MTQHRINHRALAKHGIPKDTQQTVLYIGGNFDDRKAHLPFQNKLASYSYSDAKFLLKKQFSAGNCAPDLVVIDLIPAKESLKDFIRFLRRNKWSDTTPVIYHEGALAHTDLKAFANLQLADDIVDINSFGHELGQKAAFLQQAKTFVKTQPVKTPAVPVETEMRQQLSFDHVVRRTIDVVIASILLLLVSPILLVIMLLIKSDSRGPVIYKSKRAGKGCRIFDFYKFRTMVEDADSMIESLGSENIYNSPAHSPVFFKAENDPRITKVGSFLRNTSLDELPQLINVIKGDMSLVGNRPLPLYEAAALTSNRWAERFMAPAGMTGLWQVLQRGKKNMCLEERLRLDINYARDHSLARDFWILANTPRAMFQKSNL